MRLSDLDQFEKITIQCHDNPDPDALASGLGLYRYFQSRGKEVSLIYSGRNRITKANMMLMILKLHIPVEYYPAEKGPVRGLLLTADCQFGQGNVTRIEGDEIAVIDHHNGNPGLKLQEINPGLGGCATLVWKMLREESYDVIADRDLSTALYYGLMTDTGGFAEISHPLDKDMRDSLVFNDAQIRLFVNSNISLEEMKITGKALAGYVNLREEGCGLLRADHCDPNILGIISDTAMQVKEFNVVIAYGEVSGGYKLSVRSCIREVMADEFVRYITAGVGSGGGHSFKAGGFIGADGLREKHPGVSIEEYLARTVENYFSSFTLIYAGEYEPDLAEFRRYQKKALTVGFADPLEFLDKNAPIRIRTLEGDIDTIVDGSFYLMVGILGEVYPIKTEKFNRSYRETAEAFQPEAEYKPRVYSRTDGRVFELMDHVRGCVPTGTTYIRAKELSQNVKVFTAWDEGKYARGVTGDYLACRDDDPQDVYVIRRDIFFKTYDPAEE